MLSKEAHEIDQGFNVLLVKALLAKTLMNENAFYINIFKRALVKKVQTECHSTNWSHALVWNLTIFLFYEITGMYMAYLQEGTGSWQL